MVTEWDTRGGSYKDLIQLIIGLLKEKDDRLIIDENRIITSKISPEETDFGINYLMPLAKKMISDRQMEQYNNEVR
jgi:hypothetical protein